MRVTIHHYKAYEWVPVPPDVQVTGADVAAGLVKPDAAGRWLMRVEVDHDPATGSYSHTQVGIPESTIDDMVRHYAQYPDRADAGVDRADAVRHILKKIMRHHSQQRHYVKVTVEGDLDMELHLNQHYRTHHHRDPAAAKAWLDKLPGGK